MMLLFMYPSGKLSTIFLYNRLFNPCSVHSFPFFAPTACQSLQMINLAPIPLLQSWLNLQSEHYTYAPFLINSVVTRKFSISCQNISRISEVQMNRLWGSVGRISSGFDADWALLDGSVTSIGGGEVCEPKGCFSSATRQ